ncbi:MAG: hypothetical protein AB7N61_27380 [Acidimicrobiia bacterium]
MSLAKVEEGVISTLHVRSQDLPWIETHSGSVRVLQARPDDNFIAIQGRVVAGRVSPPHRHIGPSSLFTLSGTWGHRPAPHDYGPGSYVMELAGVIHRYYGGPDEVEAISMGYGEYEYFNDELTEIVKVITVTDQLRRYMEGCEAAGLPRPNVLG